MQKILLATALTLCATGALAARFPSLAVYPSFTERKAQLAGFDPQGSMRTSAIGVDAKGKTYGYYLSKNSIRRGFVRGMNGGIETFAAPNAGTGAQHGTTVNAVNAAGDIAGFYEIDSDNSNHGFMRVGGTFTEFDPPNSFNVTPSGISSNDAVTGSFQSATTAATRSFVRRPGGRITVFDAPDAIQGIGEGTTAECINTDGVIAGEFTGRKGKAHGFVRKANGTFTKFDPPNSVFTSAHAINAAGAIAGSFQTSEEGPSHGYIRAADGSVVTFDAPGAGTGGTQGTFVNAIDDNGDVAGYVADDQNLAHAFIRKANGTFTKFQAAGVGKTGPERGTIANAINVSGVTAGVYTDKNGLEHGFVRTP